MLYEKLVNREESLSLVGLGYVGIHNHNVIMTSFSDTKPQYQISDKVIVESVNIGQGSFPKVIRHRVKQIQDLVNKHSIDVIVAFSMQLSLYPIMAKFGHNVRVVACEHSNPYYRRRSKSMEFFMSLLLPHADGYVFLTEEGRDFYGSKIASRAAVIPNPLTTTGLPEKVIDFELRNPNKICAVGSLRPVKDHETMLRAFSLVHKAVSKAVLHIYGAGDEKERLSALCNQLSITEYVVFEGLVDDIYAAIEDSYAFVQTSVSESWGCALQEAMACGIPCVSTDCDFGPRKMIKNGENGFLVEIRNPEAVAKSIITLLSDRELARRISDNAIKTRFNYSVEIISSRYQDYLQQVVSK